VSNASAIVRVGLCPDGQLEIVRWDGSTVRCAPGQAGEHLLALLRDPRLPAIETSGAGAHELAQQMIELLVPEAYRPVAVAGTPVLFSLAQTAQTWAATRAQRQSQVRTEPQDQGHAPGPNPRSAHRRGQRIA